MRQGGTFIDPAGNGFDIYDFGAIGGAITVVTIVYLFLRKRIWVPIRRSAKDALITQIRLVVRDEVGKATQPIHPDANGGKSLPDVADDTRWMKDAICAIAAHVGVELPPKPDKKKEH